MTRSDRDEPGIEDLLPYAKDSKFRLVTLASKRARQINAYFNQLGEGLGAIVPPQVSSVSRKPLSIAFEEIASGKIRIGQPLDRGYLEAVLAVADGNDVTVWLADSDTAPLDRIRAGARGRGPARRWSPRAGRVPRRIVEGVVQAVPEPPTHTGRADRRRNSS